MSGKERFCVVISVGIAALAAYGAIRLGRELFGRGNDVFTAALATFGFIAGFYLMLRGVGAMQSERRNAEIADHVGNRKHHINQ
jgi:hypothetical protein